MKETDPFTKNAKTSKIKRGEGAGKGIQLMLPNLLMPL
jgi:hypothetical protein